MAAHPGRRRRHRGRDPARRRRPTGRRRPRHRRRGARSSLQERPDAAAPGARRGGPPGRAGRCGGRARVGDARGRERRAGADRCLRPGRPAGPPGRGRAGGRDRGPAGRAGGRGARPPVARSWRPRWAPSTRRPVSRRSSCSTGAGRRRSCCAGTAATSRPVPTASARSSITRRARPCAAITAAGPRRWRRAARRAAPRGSAISAVAPSASSARSARRSRGCASAGSTATWSSIAVPPSAWSTPSPTGRLDILVGTSLVAKGLDIPSVTLVGIVSSDVALNLPDERAAERTYQLLVQAIGRAGRGELPGRAIIQTYQPDHPAIQAAASGDRTAFYDSELAMRERFGSPPFGRLVKLTVGLADAAAAEREARAMAERLRDTGDATWSGRGRRRSGTRLHRTTGRPLALEHRAPRGRSGGTPRRGGRRPVVGRRGPRVIALIGTFGRCPVRRFVRPCGPTDRGAETT